MKHHKHLPSHGLAWLVGLGSLIWLLLRSGFNPRRLTYPCQRAALANSLAFLGYLGALFGLTQLSRFFIRRKTTLTGVRLLAVLVILAGVLTGSQAPAAPALARATALPSWTSSTEAISNVFAVKNVPAPTCSLDGGALPATPPCNNPNYAFADTGVDRLIEEMEARSNYFYRTASHPTGIVGATDVVVIKINNQWGEVGDGDGLGRLSTNTDVLKGLLWRIVQHPNTFTGEIVLMENTQGAHAGVWDDDPANAEDQGQSYQDVINAFVSQGYAVSRYSLDDLNDNLITGSNVGGGYPAGEYINGNNNDAYILLEDPAGSGTNELSYPKFRTSQGTYVSLRYGIWNGSTYDNNRLTFINMPVLKKHCMAGATIAWKNYIGFVTIADNASRFPGTSDGWNNMHGFFWGYNGVGDTDYGGIGRQLALVRAAKLNIVDAIWVANESNYSGNAVRQDALVASTDPFAADWYASEYILRPVVPDAPNDSSAARGGIFRTATRQNQNVAAAVWPGGAYPYIDILNSYDGSTPSDTEKNQMNAYVVDAGTSCRPLSAVTIRGPVLGELGEQTFTVETNPLTVTLPLTYTWDNGDNTSVSTRLFGTAGGYDLSVAVSNPCSGPVTDTHHIQIVSGSLSRLYLPLLRR